MSDSVEILGLAGMGAAADLERDGAWMPVSGSPTDDQGNATMQVKLRAQSCVKAREVSQRINRRHMALFRTGKPVPPAEADKDKVEILATALVTGWKGFRTPDGAEVAPTTENVRAVMTKYPWLRDDCMMFSDDRDNYRRLDVEDVKGNSNG